MHMTRTPYHQMADLLSESNRMEAMTPEELATLLDRLVSVTADGLAQKTAAVKATGDEDAIRGWSLRLLGYARASVNLYLSPSAPRFVRETIVVKGRIDRADNE